jgi:hypothetical protein
LHVTGCRVPAGAGRRRRSAIEIQNQDETVPRVTLLRLPASSRATSV